MKNKSWPGQSRRRGRSLGRILGIALCASHIHAASWTSMTIDTFATTAFRTTALAHLPDGRFVYGVAGQMFVQDAFGAAAQTNIPVGSLHLGPSFIAVRSELSAIVGQGGYPTSNVFPFNPSAPASGVNSTALASLQEYAGVYWKSPISAREGWLIVGGNGVAGTSNVTFVSANLIDNERKVGAITQTISTYSGGIATDAAGNLYAATYDFDFEASQPTPDADQVLKFNASLVDAAVAAVIAGSPVPIPLTSSTFVYKFDGTSNIAVDALGRVWATGYAVNHLQVFDPATQAMSRVVPAHGSFPPGTDVLYTVRDFTREGTGYVAFLAHDEYGGIGTNVYTGYAPVTSIAIPREDQWRAQQFGADNLTLASESSLWGPNADPDRDGIPNLLEYAEGTSPNSTTESPIASSEQGGALRFSFVRDPLNIDLAYVVEVSGSLASNSWQEIARSTGGAATVSSGVGAGSVSEAAEGPRVRVSVTDSVVGVPRFARLRVILTPP